MSLEHPLAQRIFVSEIAKIETRESQRFAWEIPSGARIVTLLRPSERLLHVCSVMSLSIDGWEFFREKRPAILHGLFKVIASGQLRFAVLSHPSFLEMTVYNGGDCVERDVTFAWLVEDVP